MGFALPQRWEYLSTGSLMLHNESIGDGQAILAWLAASSTLQFTETALWLRTRDC